MEAPTQRSKTLYVWVRSAAQQLCYPHCAAHRRSAQDFDETVLRIHAYGLRIAAEDVAARVLDGKDGDAADLPFFQATVAAVLARGDAVAVASFGCYDVIQAYLDRMCPGVFSRDNISTPSCAGVPDGCSVPGGKNPQLDLLLRALLASEGSEACDEGSEGSSLEVHRHRVVFFDDSVQNVTVRLPASVAARRSLTPRLGAAGARCWILAQLPGAAGRLDAGGLGGFAARAERGRSCAGRLLTDPVIPQKGACRQLGQWESSWSRCGQCRGAQRGT